MTAQGRGVLSRLLFISVALFSGGAVEASLPRAGAAAQLRPAPPRALTDIPLESPSAVDASELSLFSLGLDSADGRASQAVAGGSALFEGDELTRVPRVCEARFHPLAGLQLLDDEPLRGPPPSDPETRIGVFEFLGTPLIGVEHGVTLELHWASARFGAGLASDSGFGLEYEPTAGLYYVRNRWYDPETGSFLSADPIGFPDGPNQFVWPRANYWNQDPLGLEGFDSGSGPITGDDFANQAWVTKEALKGMGRSALKALEGLGDAVIRNSVAADPGEDIVNTARTAGRWGRGFGGFLRDPGQLKEITNLSPSEVSEATTDAAITTGELVAAAEGVRGVARAVRQSGAAHSGAAYGVRPYETGPFEGLKARELPYDGLDIDHQPSKASLLKSAEKAKGGPLTPAEARDVIKKGPSVAVPTPKHRGASPTYGRRNTPPKIAADAANPSGAAARDADAMVSAADKEHKAAAKKAAKWIKAQQD